MLARTRKLNLLITALLVLTLLGVALVPRPAHAAQDPWWDGDWDYRVPIEITETSGSTLTNYQVEVTLSTSNFDYSLVEGSSGEDIRFATVDKTPCDYWIETWNSSGTSTVWVEVPSLTASATTTIYMYYGNSGASAATSFDNTFTKDFGESGLVGLWHMDEGSGTTTADSSANSNSGTFRASGEPAWAASDGGQWDGRSDVSFSSGDSLDFDGSNDYVNCGNDTSLNLTTSITVSMWIKYEGPDTWPSYQAGVHKGTSTTWFNNNWNLGFATNHIRWKGTWSNSIELDSSTTLTKGQWHHIVVVYNQSAQDAYIYIDGVKDSNENTNCQNPTTVATDLTIGEQGSTYYFNGDIDEVRIYNRALSLSEIQTQYERRKYASAAPTVSVEDRQFDTAQYTYRYSIEITETSGSTLTDYQVPVTFDTKAIDYTKVLGTNGEDIRFATDEYTQCDYWIQTWNTSGESTIWVEVPSLTASSVTTIYMFYGRSGDTAGSDGDATFEFFDDFDGTGLDTSVWNVSANDYSVSGGVLTINIGAVGLQNALSFNLQDNYMAEAETRFDELASAYGGTIPELSSSRFIASSNGNSDATVLYMRQTGSRDVYYWIGDGSASSYNVGSGSTGWTSSDSVWYITGVSVRSGTVKLWRDGTDIQTFTSISWSKNMNYISLGSFSGGASSNVQDTSYDWVRIRKFASSDPTVNLGEEISYTSWMDYFGGTAAVASSTNVSVSDGDAELGIYADAPSTVFSDSFERSGALRYYELDWTRQGTDWDEGTTTHAGSYSAHADGTCSEANDWIVTNSGLIDLSDAVTATMDLWLREDTSFDSGDWFRVWAWDGSGWVNIYEEDGGNWNSNGTWRHREASVDSSCLISDALFRITIISGSSLEDLYVDEFRIRKTLPAPGELTSEDISLEYMVDWDTFYASHTLPAGTDIDYEVLRASDSATLCTITAAQAAAGYDISSCAGTTSPIKLYANLSSTHASYAPTLHDWKVTCDSNTAPEIDELALYESDESTAATAMDPQVEYALKVTVTDVDTMNDIDELKATIFYDNYGDDPTAPTTSDTHTCAIITWNKGSGWSIDPSTNSSWAVVSGNCSTPSTGATTGDWWVHFKAGKVATESGVTDDWDIYVKVTDSESVTDDQYARDYEMNWYGEVTINTALVDWGTVAMGSDFSANEESGISVSYISNGDYTEQVQASGTWGTVPDQVTLNTSGNPVAGEFSLKADNDAVVFSDGFGGTTLNTSKWTETTTVNTSVTVDGGLAYLDYSSTAGGNGDPCYIQAIPNASYGIQECKVKTQRACPVQRMGLCFYNVSSSGWYADADDIYMYSSDFGQNVMIDYDTDYHTYEFEANGSHNIVYTDGVYKFTNAADWALRPLFGSNEVWTLRIGELWVDWVTLRRYASLSDAVLVLDTGYTTIDTGFQTGEDGYVDTSNILWLKMGPYGIAPVTYSGTIYYRIAE